MWSLTYGERRVTESIGMISGLCLALFLARILLTGTSRYWFIPENLLLAWLALVFSWLLVKNLKVNRWLSWQNIALSILWLFFLPNTWYVLTDFLHVYPTGEISELYDIVLIMTLAVSGFSLGIVSLFMVHKELIKRFGRLQAYRFIELIILAASFGIYLGRDLRWSSWDVIKDPSGIILNVSDRVIDPLGHPSAINVTVLFFILLSAAYAAVYRCIVPPDQKDKRA